MASPRSETYTAASGAAVYAGRAAPSSPTPAWAVGATVGQWLSIPGTVGPGAGLNTDAFCDITLRPSDSTLLVAAAGGHNDGNSNAVAKLTLSADAPAWQTLRASSWNGSEINVNYYADGSPCSRHTYDHSHYIADIGNGHDGILLAGCQFGWGGNTPTHGGMDVFDLVANQYLPANTWPSLNTGTMYYGTNQDAAGNIWTQLGHKFTMATKTWSKPGTGTLDGRIPSAYDSTNNRFFSFAYKDGWGFDNGETVSSSVLDPVTGNSVDITYNASAALTQFIADQPQYGALAYCPVDGKFYFMHGGRIGTFYVVTPNGGTTWDVATWTPGGSPPPSGGALCKRLLWVPALQGFVLQSRQDSNLQFLKMV